MKGLAKQLGIGKTSNRGEVVTLVSPYDLRNIELYY